MPSGGLQKPANPAPQSGPGALSQRTDGGVAQVMRDLPNAKYGENTAFRDIESGAPMAAAPPGGGGGLARGAGSPSPPSMDPPQPLSGGSLNPDEPVTAGAALGPGPNGMMLPAPPQEAATALSVVQRAAMNGGAQAAALLARIQTGL